MPSPEMADGTLRVEEMCQKMGNWLFEGMLQYEAMARAQGGHQQGCGSACGLEASRQVAWGVFGHRAGELAQSIRYPLEGFHSD